MTRLSTLFIPLVALFFLCVRSAPATGVSRRDDPPVEDIINALQTNGLISHVHVLITLNTLVNNLVTLDFDATNPVATELTLDRVVVTGSLNDTVWLTFDQEFAQPAVVSSLGTANSGPIPNVLLTQGAIPSLDIIPLGMLDLSTDVFLRAGATGGSMGVPIQITGLKQVGVTTSYDLVLE